MAGEKQLASVLKLEPIDPPPFSGFIGHGYLQYESAKFRSYHSMRYHVNVVLTTIPTLDAIWYSDGDSFAISTYVVVTGTGNDSEAEVSAGTSNGSEWCGYRFVELIWSFG